MIIFSIYKNRVLLDKECKSLQRTWQGFDLSSWKHPKCLHQSSSRGVAYLIRFKEKEKTTGFKRVFISPKQHREHWTKCFHIMERKFSNRSKFITNKVREYQRTLGYNWWVVNNEWYTYIISTCSNTGKMYLSIFHVLSY